MMKRFLLFLFLAPLCPVAHAASEKPNTVLIHPGEVIYARFAQKGIKLTLLSASKEKDDLAQVVLTIPPADPTKKAMLPIKVENKFGQYLHYKAEMRVVSRKQRTPMKTSPVVPGKMALEQLPPMIEELAVYAFALEK